MFSILAFNRTVVLLSAMLLMVFLWGIFHIPQANFLVVCFTFLSSALLMEIPSFKGRLNRAVLMALYASSAQFLISVSEGIFFVQIMLLTFFAYFSFLTLPDYRAGCIVMITGVLAFFAPSGFFAGISRAADIFCGVLVIMAVTTLCPPGHDKSKALHLSTIPFSCRQALILAAELGIGTWIFRMLRMEQGPWIMLTMLFISMSSPPGASERKAAFQRISAVPLGIIIGGFLLGSFCRIDYRFVYLVPLIAAAGFWILYNCGNFFLFSILFMAALTLFSDWTTGSLHRYNFWESFFSRSFATLLGALPELFREQWQGDEKRGAA